MALSKVNYVDNQTIITAQNLNDIQNEIIQNTELIKNVAPRNLLDNSDFQDPVNQLGFKSGTAVESHAGFIDRWRNGGESSITPNLSSNGIEPNGTIYQTLYLPSYIGKKMTLAVGFSEGNVVIASGTLTEASTDFKMLFSTTDGTNEIGVASYGGIWMAGINCPNSIIQWAALYEDEYTAETLPEYQPKGYENELLVCHQYNPYTDEYIGLSKFSPPQNLLDNSDFRNPVNQRGIPGDYQYFSRDYTIDRWILDSRTGGRAGIKLSETGVVISNSGDYSAFTQYVIADTEKKYTLAVGTGDGVKILSGVPSANIESQFLKMKVSSQGYLKCYILIPSSEMNLYWAALYEGEYTAETLPEYQPKGYGAELAECQRYFQVVKSAGSEYITPIGFGYATSATNGRICIPIVAQMRDNVVPSIKTNGGTISVRFGTGYATVSDITIIGSSVRVPTHSVIASVTTTGLTTNQPVILTITSGELQISADL